MTHLAIYFFKFLILKNLFLFLADIDFWMIFRQYSDLLTDLLNLLFLVHIITFFIYFHSVTNLHSYSSKLTSWSPLGRTYIRH